MTALLPRALLALPLLCAAAAPAPPAAPVPVDGFTTLVDLSRSDWVKKMPPREAWRRAAPQVREVRIRSRADGTDQPSLFYAPDAPGPRPLLVVLHSWSADYLQPYSLPHALWAIQNGWIFVHPDFRGRFRTPQTTASDLAVQDVLDAVAYAREHASVDPSRVYLVGFSGGGLMALALAGRHPALWAGVVAWCPVFVLTAWHRETRTKYPRYARDIRLSCGGAPTPGSAAARECDRRSPRRHLAAARAGPRVLVTTGIDDPFVSPRHAFEAFNVLADPADRLTDTQMDHLAGRRAVPAGIEPSSDPLHDAVGRPLLFERTSGTATLRVFKGRHDVIYNSDLRWLAGQER